MIRFFNLLSVSCLLFIAHFSAQAQQHPSAALQINSTTQGLLPPRMSKAERDAIADPAQGLIVFCTDCQPQGALYLYSTPSGWTDVVNKISTEISDNDKDTQIQVEENQDEDLIRFDTDGQQRMVLDKNGNLGLGTDGPHSSALLELNSTDRALLLPRLTTAQRDALPNPSPGMILFNTTTQYTERYTTAGWNDIPDKIERVATLPTTGVVSGRAYLNHTRLNVARENPNEWAVFEGYFKHSLDLNQDGDYLDVGEYETRDYGTIVSPVTGRIWLDRSIGATRSPTGVGDFPSVTDNLGLGYYYLFDDAQKACPNGYRPPSMQEYCAEMKSNTVTACVDLGVGSENGFSDHIEAYQQLKLIRGGASYRRNAILASSEPAGNRGRYWTNSRSGAFGRWYLWFGSDGTPTEVNSTSSPHAIMVLCIKD